MSTMTFQPPCLPSRDGSPLPPVAPSRQPLPLAAVTVPLSSCSMGCTNGPFWGNAARCPSGTYSCRSGSLGRYSLMGNCFFLCGMTSTPPRRSGGRRRRSRIGRSETHRCWLQRELGTTKDVMSLVPVSNHNLLDLVVQRHHAL
jgi:hypothetical protein